MREILKIEKRMRETMKIGKKEITRKNVRTGRKKYGKDKLVSMIIVLHVVPSKN